MEFIDDRKVQFSVWINNGTNVMIFHLSKKLAALMPDIYDQTYDGRLNSRRDHEKWIEEMERKLEDE